MRSCFRTILPALVVLAVGLTLAASGCAATPEPVPPAPAPSPTASAVLVFASNEEALAAATEAYAAYQELATLVFSEGGENADRLKSVSSGSFEELLLMEFNDTRAAGHRSTGKTTFDNLRLQQVNENATDGKGVVIIYLCSDVSQVDVLDASDVSQVNDGRLERIAFEVGFDWEPGQVGVLTVSSRYVWDRGGVC
jgi:hypothetical protein